MKILRGILAIVVGFIAAAAVMIVIEAINGRILYPELGKLAEGGVTDREQIRAILAEAPVGALLVVLVGWVLASFVGGYITAWIGRHAPITLAVVLGVLLTCAGILNNLMIPPPAWFWVLTLFAYVPAAYAGARLRSASR